MQKTHQKKPPKPYSITNLLWIDESKENTVLNETTIAISQQLEWGLSECLLKQ